MLKLFTDERIAPRALFRDVQAKAFTILDRQQIEFVATHLTRHARFDETMFQWEHVEELAPQFKRQLRPLLLAIEWTAVLSHAPLLDAVHSLQTAFRKGRTLSQYALAIFPQRFIPDSVKRYVYAADQCLVPNRYEFFVYRRLRNGLEANDIFCRDSVRFRSFAEDLLDDQHWQAKDALIEQMGLTSLKQPIREHVADLEQRLEARLVAVNDRIAEGENEHFETKRRGTQVRWTLRYPRSSGPVNHPFFDDLKQGDLGSVLHFVNQHCPFMSAFEPVLGRYTKLAADTDVLTACLLAWGTNMGLSRMAASSDISSQTLAPASENFSRLETLREANERVRNAIAALPTFRHYDLADTLHSSSDGQKVEIRIPTINARHSPKYFGLKKGVVSSTLVTNTVPVNAEIIGAHDHESHSVFAILFNNTTNIQPTVHSTDTPGTNEGTFALLHLFGYRFAPRSRDIYDKVHKALYGFQHPSQHPAEMVLRSIRKLSPELIIDEWDNIRRLMVSLALKTTTQGIIVRKPSAFARTNKTRRALWEYDHIIRSLSLLDSIDAPPLRQQVQRPLNRGEHYHQLRRAAVPRELRQATLQDRTRPTDLGGMRPPAHHLHPLLQRPPLIPGT